MNKAVGIIPVRFGARRFPGKPLAPILGKPMVQWVFERARKARYLSRLIVATDDRRILEAATAFGAEAVMTSPHHTSGTERAAEVLQSLEAGIAVNIQGDEPLIHPEMIDSLVEALQDDSLPMATLARKRPHHAGGHDENTVKVVIDKHGYALYFSRAPVPYGAADYFWEHVGLYGYQRDFLLKFQELPASRLEEVERLEQLRVLENGYRIKVLATTHPTLSVDTPEDIIKVENMLKKG